MRLKSLLLSIVVIAIFLAAVRSPNRYSSLAVSEMTLLLLLISIVAALFGTGHIRAFWVGFSVMGWGHHIAAYGPWFQEAYGGLLQQTLEAVAVRAYPDDIAFDEYAKFGPQVLNAISICRSFWILSSAVLGGMIAVRIQKRSASVRSLASSRNVEITGAADGLSTRIHVTNRPLNQEIWPAAVGNP